MDKQRLGCLCDRGTAFKVDSKCVDEFCTAACVSLDQGAQELAAKLRHLALGAAVIEKPVDIKLFLGSYLSGPPNNSADIHEFTCFKIT